MAGAHRDHSRGRAGCTQGLCRRRKSHLGKHARCGQWWVALNARCIALGTQRVGSSRPAGHGVLRMLHPVCLSQPPQSTCPCVGAPRAAGPAGPHCDTEAEPAAQSVGPSSHAAPTLLHALSMPNCRPAPEVSTAIHCIVPASSHPSYHTTQKQGLNSSRHQEARLRVIAMRLLSRSHCWSLQPCTATCTAPRTALAQPSPCHRLALYWCSGFRENGVVCRLSLSTMFGSGGSTCSSSAIIAPIVLPIVCP